MRIFKGVIGSGKQQALLHLFAVVVCGMIALTASGSRAVAGGDGFRGWLSQGLYFGSASAACANEWSTYVSPTGSQFIGAEMVPDNPLQARCKWTTYLHGCPGGGFPVPPHGCSTVDPNAVVVSCQPGNSLNGSSFCQAEPNADAPSCGAQKSDHKGNPINIASGAKNEYRADFATADGRLKVERLYNSLPRRFDLSAVSAEPMGQTGGWGFGFSLEWHIDPYIGTSLTAPGGYGGTLFLPDGTAFNFARNGSTFPTSVYGTTLDYKVEFVGTVPADWGTVFAASSQWKVTDQRSGRVYLLQTFPRSINDALPRYSIARVIKITEADGYFQNLTYGSAGQLQTVTDSYNRTLGITWRQYVPITTTGVAGFLPTSDVVDQITLPDGNKLVYTYDPPVASPSNGPAIRLLSVTRKTAANATVETITYHYEDTRFPTFLTGITDSRGIRYANFAYDGQGRATLSEHAGSDGKITIAYSTVGSDYIRTVTNALGKVSV
jgi:hypothetical protein